MSLKKVTMWVVFGLVLASSPLVLANDAVTADWQGEDRTGFAELNSAGPGDVPDSWLCSPGGLDAPFHTVADSSVFCESYEDGQDVWQINEDDSIACYVPKSPAAYNKEIQVQVAHFVDENAEPTWGTADLRVEGDDDWEGDIEDFATHCDY